MNHNAFKLSGYAGFINLGILSYSFHADVNLSLDQGGCTKIECDYVRIGIMLKPMLVEFYQIRIITKNIMQGIKSLSLLFYQGGQEILKKPAVDQ